MENTEKVEVMSAARGLHRKESSVMDVESHISPSPERKTGFDLESTGKGEGYILDVEILKQVTPNWQDFKLAKDGKTVLIPQPSSDPNDPLNWSQFKKNTILFIIAAAAFLPDYGAVTGAGTLTPQSIEWNTTPDYINQATAGTLFMLGAGGIFVVILSAYCGRLPVLFWFIFTAIWTAAGCAASQTFDAFMAFRILNGFFSTVAQGGGIMFVKDMYFVHERPRKIDIWALFLILSPLFGPLIALFMTSTTIWQWPFGLYTIMCGLVWFLIIFFVDETFYNRRLPPDQRPRKTPGAAGQLARLIGIEQWRSRHQRSTFAEACMRPIRVFLKPTIALSCLASMLVFSWAIGITTTLTIFLTTTYGFDQRALGFFYFTPIVGAVAAEVIGHWLHDFLARIQVRHSKEHKLEPEMRLTAITISTPFMVGGLLVLGFALQNEWHYMISAVGWGLYVFGYMITIVALTSYNLDCYPEGAGEISAWLNFARTTGGFVISYVQVRWAAEMGVARTLAVQAALTFVAYLVVLSMQFFGKKIRERAGPLRFKTD